MTRASLITDHKISSLPIRAEYKHLRTICAHTYFFFLDLMVGNTWSCDFVYLLSCSIRQFGTSYHAFLCMTFHIIGPWRYRFGIKFLHGFCFWQFSIAPAEILDSNIFLFDNLVECNPIEHSQGTMSVLPNQRLSYVFSTLGEGSVSCVPVFVSSTYTDKNRPLSRLTNKKFPIWKISPTVFY